MTLIQTVLICVVQDLVLDWLESETSGYLPFISDHPIPWNSRQWKSCLAICLGSWLHR